MLSNLWIYSYSRILQFEAQRGVIPPRVLGGDVEGCPDGTKPGTCPKCGIQRRETHDSGPSAGTPICSLGPRHPFLQRDTLILTLPASQLMWGPHKTVGYMLRL